MRKIIVACLLLLPLSAKALIFDFTGFAYDRDREPMGGRGIDFGSPVSGFFDLDMRKDRFDGPSILQFEIFAGTLHGYNLESPVVHYGSDEHLLGEWVEQGDQRSQSPDAAHRFQFLYAINMDTLHASAGLYSLNDRPLDGIPEFMINCHLTERRDVARANNVPEQPIPEPTTLALLSSALIPFFRKVRKA